MARQVGFEQLSFWLNPIGALMTIAFSVVFLILLGATAGTSTVSSYGHIKLIDYYVAGFCAYGVMAACFTILAISLVNRREMGLLKRLRLSPLPTWMAMSAVLLNAMIVAALGVILLLVVGRLGYGVHGPAHWLPFIVTLVVGMLCFSALGVGVSTLVPNADAAGPIVSLTFFILVALSGLWFPIAPNSGLATFADYFPIRHLIDALVGSFTGQPGTPCGPGTTSVSWPSGAWGVPSSGCVAGPGRRSGAEADPVESRAAPRSGAGHPPWRAGADPGST